MFDESGSISSRNGIRMKKLMMVIKEEHGDSESEQKGIACSSPRYTFLMRVSSPLTHVQ
jgi:hypothetical protein